MQCIANLLDLPGGLKFFDGPAKPRSVMAAAQAHGIGVMAIRAVQAGALTASLDRPLPGDHPEVRDYALPSGFRTLCAEIGEDPAIVAHRYALGLSIDTLVLGVKNRAELAGCVAAAEADPLSAELVAASTGWLPRPDLWPARAACDQAGACLAGRWVRLIDPGAGAAHQLAPLRAMRCARLQRCTSDGPS